MCVCRLKEKKERSILRKLIWMICEVCQLEIYTVGQRLQICKCSTWVQNLLKNKLETQVGISMLQSWGEFLCFKETLSSLLSPSMDWMRIAHVVEGNMLYFKSTDNLQLKYTFTTTSRLVFWPNNWHHSLAKLTYKIEYHRYHRALWEKYNFCSEGNS